MDSSDRLAKAGGFLGNAEQLQAYKSQGHCVVLAGPGSGKTKTLVEKLAQLLSEVRAPRGVACITYSQECARELTRRLERLGIRSASNLFVGTVHGFCLRHLVTPYARLAELGLPHPLSIATQKQQTRAWTRSGEALFGSNHPHKHEDMLLHRRVHLDRKHPAWWKQVELAQWAERYDDELRALGLIDFDDLVIAGQLLLERHRSWVAPLVQAKFPIIAVDEYQDLGVGLHRIVKHLAFGGGVRLFAVGDPDQTVYQFAGADEALLRELAERPDVERVQLRLNYRSAGPLVRASEIALGEARGYRAIDPERRALIALRRCPDGLEDQARHAITQIVPAALARKPGRKLGDIAILYRDSTVGEVVAKAATEAGLDFVRVDKGAPYKKCALTSWVEDCAAWCAGGWREAQPRLRGLLERWQDFLGDHVAPKARRDAIAAAVVFLREHRQSGLSAHDFVRELRAGILDDAVRADPTLADQAEQLHRMSDALAPGGALDGISLARLGGQDGTPEQLNLLTLHSAKGCEYDVVIMVGLDWGSLPWRNENAKKLKESRKLFYVGFTRPRDEIHMLYSGFVETRKGPMRWGRSPFLDELEARLRDGVSGKA